MKSPGRRFLLAFLILVPCVAFGEVSTKVFLRDSNEPLVPVEVNIALKYVDYGQIMVGTELAIVIDSNVAESWSGRLLLEEDYRNYGVLYARGEFDPYFESCLEAAGADAWVTTAFDYWEEEEKWVQGFDLYTDTDLLEVSIGDWFIIDYNAVEVGDTNIALYWQEWLDEPPFYDYGLIHHIQFSQVPTRDFDGDGRVDFNDFSIFATYWYDSNCDEPNLCQGANLDNYGIVDLNDLMLFTEYWLVKTK